jgi:excisionase family DNA binding protein
MSDFLDVAAVARRLGVSVRLVTRWIDEGELRAIEGVGRGRGLRVAAAWLEAFIEARKPTPLSRSGTTRSPVVAKCAANEQPFSSVRDARAKLLGGGR